MKAPSIAVMLAGKPESEHEEGAGEPGLAEAKEAAQDAAKALMHAVAARDPEGVYRSFRSLNALCREIDDLEDSGEAEEETEGEPSDHSEEHEGLKEDTAE